MLDASIPLNRSLNSKGSDVRLLPIFISGLRFGKFKCFSYIGFMKAIYRIQNLKTGDFYIGSSVNYNYRKWIHLHDLRKGKHHSPILQNSWNKHGESAFIFGVVEEIEEKEELIEREQHYLDVLNPKYNICKLAGSTLGVKHTYKARLNMSNAHKKLTKEQRNHKEGCKCFICFRKSGENHHFFGKNRSDEDKKKVSKGVKEYYKNGGIHPHKGKVLSQERKNKLSIINSIPINQYNLEGNLIAFWESAKKAAKMLHLHATNISQCCNGKVSHAGGFIWSYKAKTPIIKSKFLVKNLAVESTNILTREVKNYDSMKRASIEENLDYSSISRACRGKQFKCGNFYWKTKSK